MCDTQKQKHKRDLNQFMPQASSNTISLVFVFILVVI